MLKIKPEKPSPCSADVTSDKEVSSKLHYVDKTLLIKDIIDGRNKAMVFLRPQGFGKTLAMDMLKTYFKKSEEDTSIYFSSRKIWSCGDSYRAYQGVYPVIYLSFKDAHQDKWVDMHESLALSLRDEFRRHEGILNSDDVSPSDKAFFKKILDGEASLVEYQASLGQLSRMLFDAYKSRVIVIIDEYDTPIQQGYSRGYYDEVVSFMRNLFSAVLKDTTRLNSACSPASSASRRKASSAASITSS